MKKAIASILVLLSLLGCVSVAYAVDYWDYPTPFSSTVCYNYFYTSTMTKATVHKWGSVFMRITTLQLKDGSTDVTPNPATLYYRPYTSGGLTMGPQTAITKAPSASYAENSVNLTDNIMENSIKVRITNAYSSYGWNMISGGTVTGIAMLTS